MDDGEDVRVRSASDHIAKTKMTPTLVSTSMSTSTSTSTSTTTTTSTTTIASGSSRAGGTRIAMKKEAAASNRGSGSATPTAPSKNGDDYLSSPSLSSADLRGSSSDGRSSPESSGGGPAARLSRKASSLQQQQQQKAPGTSRSSSAPSSRRLFDHLPDATSEATSEFQIITDCLYGSKHMGSSEHVGFECDCSEEWRDGTNQACGEDSDCINRATKMECVEGDCNCGNGCQNQRFQRKEYARVSVIKTEKKGYGLRADAELQAHDFIFEYIGEVINEATFRRRMLQYDEEGIKHFYFMSLTKNEFVDATRKGNLGRFCNHSCSPNCYVDKWVVGEKLRMGIFASRDIRAGEELVFDYNVDRYGADPQTCYCGEPCCTGFIGGKTQTERATKLSQATIEALGIEDPDSWDTMVATGAGAVAARKPRRKRPNEDDEAYVSSLAPPSGLAEDGVTKVMAALMQCKEKWIAVKLLARLQSARHDERVLNRVVQMHGYQILRSLLVAFHDDNNVLLQVLDILYHFPRLTKNKISDSSIEDVVQTLTVSEHEDVAAESKRLLDEWSKLETAYRIPRKKFDPSNPNAAALVASSFEDRRGGARDEPTQQNGHGHGHASGDDDSSNNSARAGRPAQPLSPLHGIVVPKGPRSSIPQRNANFYNGNGSSNGNGIGNGNGNGNGSLNNPNMISINNGSNAAARGRRLPKAAGLHGLPAGWFTATDPNGNIYYYTKGGATTWKRPTLPADGGSGSGMANGMANGNGSANGASANSGTANGKAGGGPARAPTRAQQEKNAVQEIIDSLTKETPRPSATQTPQTTNTPVAAAEVAKEEKWRSFPIEKQMKIYENTLFPHIKSVTDRFRHQLPKEEIKKFGKDISKKLVASDYKNNRVEDPHVIHPRQEKKVKAYVRDFFERAAKKYQDHEKRKSERAARHAAAHETRETAVGHGKNAGGPEPVTTAAAAAAAAAASASGNKVEEAPMMDADDAKASDSVVAPMDDMAMSDDEDQQHNEHVNNAGEVDMAMDGVSPGSGSGGDGKKRKRTESSAPSPNSLLVAQSKRLKDEDAGDAEDAADADAETETDMPIRAPLLPSGSAVPPPPPPPPPPPLPPAEMKMLRQEQDEERSMREQEEELVRENEEAQRQAEEEEEAEAEAEEEEAEEEQQQRMKGDGDGATELSKGDLHIMAAT